VQGRAGQAVYASSGATSKRTPGAIAAAAAAATSRTVTMLYGVSFPVVQQLHSGPPHKGAQMAPAATSVPGTGGSASIMQRCSLNKHSCRLCMQHCASSRPSRACSVTGMGGIVQRVLHMRASHSCADSTTFCWTCCASRPPPVMQPYQGW
jgi:hypothetical protein